MHGYNKCSVGPFLSVHSKGNVEASMEGYSKGSMGPIITVHNNG
jgi:hypothetical protein